MLNESLSILNLFATFYQNLVDDSMFKQKIGVFYSVYWGKFIPGH